KALYNFATM
nr:Chain C, Glycoprotein 9-residue peptide [synthetic construct]1S7W_C Chain C, Glycoprotein 9-residue peptide [synthetic construct]1S7W_F Chain F, Glycoprotein 9-residue peptide [synthetic construct]1S7W_I Chain I, Glycoprotein 9-residue peptide [synthetic construct]1S7W_L Chain L, Glycoprotein 9-residue peptide [synthetic construct]